jgi:hypothetical protein
MGSLLFRGLHNLQIMMIVLIMLLELGIFGIIFKEVYDLVFLEEAQRKIDLEKNRRLYIKRERLISGQTD